MKGFQVYATKIVTVWTVTGPKQLLNVRHGKKQDWGDQPLFGLCDLYVVPEALIYEIFNSIII